jgi:predicted flavoprotein YhiN
VLDVSHIAVRARRAHITVRWSGLGRKEWEAALRADGARSVASAVRAELPDRLALMLLASLGLDPATPLAQLRREHRGRLLDTLTEGELPWTGDEGYRKAEVTGGGIALAEVDPRTMESRRHPGLFICGEVLDAFGPIGGYNFLWAWATGRAAGLGAGSGES